MSTTIELLLVGGLLGCAAAFDWEAIYRAAPNDLAISGWRIHHSLVGIILFPAALYLKIQAVPVWDILAVSFGSGFLVAYAGLSGWQLPIIHRD